MQYSKISVILHWLSVPLLAFLLLSGTFVLANIPNTLEKLPNIKLHSILGFVVMVLSLVRLYFIFGSKTEPLKMSPARALLLKANHAGIYLCVFLIALSGFALNLQSGVAGAIMSGANDFSMYENMSEYLCGYIHKVLTKILPLLIVMHVLGVFSYMIANKTNIIKRMWF